MKTRKRKFTIIELLVVIAIIGVLMGMLLPAVSAVRQNARKTRAKSEISGIIAAIKQYEQTYGYFPVDSNYTATDLGEYRTLMEILTCYDGPDTGTTIVGTTGNSRNVRFLDAPSNYGTSTDELSNSITNLPSRAVKGDYTDPWGNYYQIYVDTNYNGVFNNADDGCGSNTSIENKNGSVFVYSVGPDQKDTPGSGETSTYNKDNICSWK